MEAEKESKMEAEKESFYSKLYESSAAKNISIAAALTFLLITGMAIAGVLIFHRLGSDRKRTIINLLIASICYSLIQGIVFVQIPYIINYAVGPLPQYVCYAIVVMRHAIFTHFIVFISVVSIMKYVYIFWLKNPAAFHDDFWCIFINIFINLFGFISQLTWHLTLPRQPIGFYICAGIDPTEYLKTPLKIYGVLEISCLLLNMFIFLRIKVYKSEERHFGPRKKLFLTNIESLTNFGIILANVVIVFLFLGNQIIVNQMSASDINKFPYTLNVYFTFLILPGLMATTSLLMHYHQSKAMRTFLASEIREWFGRLQEKFFLHNGGGWKGCHQTGDSFAMRQFKRVRRNSP